MERIMELLQLKYFKDAYITRNFSHTANKFLVPPSAVSSSVKRLEEELGAPLFTRSSNKIEPNEFGKLFYNHVNLALVEIERGVEKIKNYSEDARGTINILIENNRRIITDVIAEFKSKYPRVSFVIFHQRTPGVKKDFDIIISAGGKYEKSYRATPIIKERILLSVPRSHMLAGERVINPAMLKNEQFISMPEGSNLHEMLYSLLAEYDIVPDIAISCDDPSYVRKYTAMGLGISLFPEFSWLGLESEQVVNIPFSEGDAERVTYMLYKGDGGECCHRFREFLKEKLKGKV